VREGEREVKGGEREVKGGEMEGRGKKGRGRRMRGRRGVKTLDGGGGRRRGEGKGRGEGGKRLPNWIKPKSTGSMVNPFSTCCSLKLEDSLKYLQLL
jgi:hypothetical protein